jgi:hypothetical protein
MMACACSVGNQSDWNGIMGISVSLLSDSRFKCSLVA